MDLKLTEHVRNTISLLYKKKTKQKPKKQKQKQTNKTKQTNKQTKTGEIPIFGTFFSEKINFGQYFAENRHYQDGHHAFYVIVMSYFDRFS